MHQYIVAGLVIGGVYAIAASGLVLTYVSTGVLNFAFGAQAYLIARFFYYLNVEQGWSLAPAAVVALASAPLLGVLLYFLLFRFLRNSTQLIKIVATIGLSVTIPPFASMVFGEALVLTAPGLAPQPVRIFQVFGFPITADQMIVFAAVLLLVVVGGLVLRYTSAGICTRAIVDSEAMTSLSGTRPWLVYVGVWSLSTFFAGLAGVLAAPTIGLTAPDYTLLTAAAFAAVVAAKLRSLGIAVVVGLLIGVVGALVQYWMPPNSTLTAAVIASIPFAFIVIALAFYMREGRVSEIEEAGGALDKAILTQPDVAASSAWERERPSRVPVLGGLRWGQGLAAFVVMVALPLMLSGFWAGIAGSAMAFAVVFLSFTLVTGEGGMIWLCQITFAGVGGLTAAQLASKHGWPVLLAIVAGGLLAMPMGVIIGFVTLRLGDLYVALVTLTFGLLMERLVFSRDTFANIGAGVNIARPGWADSDRAYAFLVIAVFCLFALYILKLRRSTAGLALNAVRWSEPGSQTIGLSVVQMKLLVSGLAAFVAGVGGGLLAGYYQVANPISYATLTGTVWLAVLVTMGVRSNTAAMLAGVAFVYMPALFSAYLPSSVGQVPALLFGLGAVMVARDPDGVVAANARSIRDLVGKLLGVRKAAPPGMAGAGTTDDDHVLRSNAAVGVSAGVGGSVSGSGEA